MIEKDLKLLLERITSALERIAPPINTGGNIEVGDAFIWQSEKAILEPVVKVQRIDLSLLKGIDHQREILLSNTTNFANGLPANNALLWGARGSGKSSLVNEVLAKSAANELNRAKQLPGAHSGIQGLDHFEKVVRVDQSPIGKSPRSNPATFVKLFDLLRKLVSLVIHS